MHFTDLMRQLIENIEFTAFKAMFELILDVTFDLF